MKPARQLELMIRELKQVPIEDLHHRDWLGVLQVLKEIVRDVNLLGTDESFGILINAVQRSQRSSLPIPNRREPDPDS